MQHFDHLWKAELQSQIESIKEAASEELKKDRAFLLDRPLLYSAFIVRKLIEDTAVTDRLRGSWLQVAQHPSSRDEPPFIEIMAGALKVQDHFNLAEHTFVRISYGDIASEIIHSDGLVWTTADGGKPNGFLVFSYRNALKRLLAIGLDQYIAVLEMVVADQPQRWWLDKDLKSGDVTRHAE
jgi:hypothetical protein